MNALPIMHRELRVLAKRPWFYWLRSGVGTAIAIVSCVVFTVTANAGATPAGLGGPLFLTVTLMSYLLCLLAGPVLLSDSVAGEKAAGTLGLLFLTNTRSHDIVGGKFVALALPALHCLLASVPIQAIAFFLGGVTAGEFLRTTAALLTVLFFSLASTVLCSVVAASGRRAFGGALMLVLVCGAGLPALVLFQPGLANHWLIQAGASPALGLWFARDAAYATNAAGFTSAISLGQLMGWSALVAAILALPRFWREQPEPPRRAPLTSIVIGSKRPANADPVAWLARRRLGGAAAAWMLTLGTVILVGALFSALQTGTLTGLTVVFVAYAMHGVFKVWVAWVSSHAFGTERDSGALELLLVTPLGETAIWRAWLAGLRRRYLLPALALVGFDLVLTWVAAFHAPDGILRMEIFFLTFLAAIIFLMDCYALSWSGLWNGLAARNATRATIQTLLGWIVLPGILFVTAVFGSALVGTLNTDSLTLMVVLWATASFILDVVVGSLSMVRLSHDCREATVRRLG